MLIKKYKIMKKKTKAKYDIKKIKITLLVIILVLITFVMFFAQNRAEKTYSVIHIVSADTFYVDFNKNDKPDIDELVKLSSVNSLKPSFASYLEPQLEYIGIDKPSGVLVGSLANKYAEQNLLYKNVQVKFTKEKLKEEELGYRFANVYLNEQDWAITLLAHGFATVYRESESARKYLKYENTYKIKELAKEELAKNYVIVNLKTEKYHKLTCKYGQIVKDFVLIRQDELPDFYEKGVFCFGNDKKEQEKLEQQYVKSFDVKSQSVSMFFSDFTKHLKPSNDLVDEPARVLIRHIASAQKTIDIAAYGLDDNSIITNALINAQKRGVKVRIVADKNTKNETPYKTNLLEKFFKNIVYDTDNETLSAKDKNSLMHNKFLIFDDDTVYTGSLNIAKNDLSGYNSNVCLLISSPKIVEIYKKEFEQMFSGKFHTQKAVTQNNENIQVDSENIVGVYFSPQDKVIDTKIIPLINNAKKYIYMPIFAFTNKNMMNALINAQSKGVDVRIITDATNVYGENFGIDKLRNSGIKLKIENYAGKMHMKSIIIDDEYIVVGSMNFSSAGQNKNDENVLIIKNPKLAKNYKNQFLYMYEKIHDRWLKDFPGAETSNSIGACEDGVDNDFDGLIDNKDSSCKIKK